MRMTNLKKHGSGLLLRMLIAAGGISGSLLLVSAEAAALTITPNTWNIVGLDSNTPAFGPNRFPVGAKVCGGTPGATDTAGFTWDAGGTNPDDGTYIYLRPGSANPVTITFGADGCADAYFEVEVSKTSGDAPFDKTRRYHITAGGASTPAPRELYVEHLISQSRNYITNVELNGVSIPAGGSMNLMKGSTYTIKLYGGTATQGYNQFEEFINFPNTIFQVLSVSTAYSADSNTINVPNPNDKLYADACIWENDPDSPYYLSCVGGDDKAGGNNVVTTYTVKIIDGVGTSQTLGTLLYDFSGSSFHYNADYSTGWRVANIFGPSSVTINKSFTPKTISPNGISTMTIRLANPTSETLTNVNFSDTFPAGMSVASSPDVTFSGCGAGAFSPVLAGGATSASFSGATLAPNSICTITAKVTAPLGTYPNTAGPLFINSTVDTGNTGSDTLTASIAPSCTAGQTLVNWTVPVGSANPPDTATGGAGSPTTNNTGYTAAASAGTPASTGIGTTGFNDTASWEINGQKTGNDAQFAVDTRNYSGVVMTFQMKNASPSNGPTTATISYNSGSGFVTHPTATLSLPTTTSWTAEAIDFSGLTSTTGPTTFRIATSGAKNDNSGAGLNYDVITFSGCRIAAPPPTITKSFSPVSIAKGSASALTFNISNTQADNKALTGVAFTDVLPAGLSIADSSAAQCGGTLTTTASTRTIALTGGALAAGGGCSFNISVTGTTEGQYQNVSGNITSTQSGPNTTASGYATASLTVIAPPVLAEAFSPTSLFTNDPSTLTFTIANPNLASALSGIGFTGTLSAGLTVATSGPTATCGGSLSTTSPSTVSFTGGSLAANSGCEFSVTVTGVATGTKNSTTTAVTSTQGGNGNTASASLVVNNKTPSIDLTKQVSTSATGPWANYAAVAENGSVYYRFKVYNSGDVPLYNIGVTETAGSIAPACSWPEPLAVGDTAYCVSSAITAAAGTHVNTAYAHAQYPGGGAVYNSADSSATYATTGLTLAKTADKSYFLAAGEVLTYSYLVTNSGFATLAGPVTVADDKTTVSCPAVSTAVLVSDGSPGDGDNYLDPGEKVSCSASYTVAAADVTAKQVTNTASATVGGVTSPTAVRTVPLAADLTAIKTNSVGGSVLLGNTFKWTLTVGNAAVAGTATFADGQTLLTDDLPTSGATYAAGAVTKAGATGTINCAVAANTLNCTASGAVTIPPALQGTVSVTSASATVTGAGTAFMTQLVAGSIMSINGVPYTVSSITSDSQLTLTANYAGASAAGLVIPASFSVPVTVTPTAGGPLINPKSGGACKANPAAAIAEIDQTNNDCADTVTVLLSPSLTVVKSVQPFSDPVNGTTNPKAIPGSVMQYTIQVVNSGQGTVDNNTTVITDQIPANTELFVGDINGAGSGPVLFTDGATPSGLSYSFIDLASAADGLSFSGDGGVSYSKSDTTADANQCDSTVTHLKIILGGSFNASDGTNHPSFNVKFKVRVK